MKRLVPILFTALFVFAACGNEDDHVANNKQEQNDENYTNIEEGKDEVISVDKSLGTVEITLPTTFFEGQDKEQVIIDAKENGIKEVTENEDGSLTYKMSKSKHKEMMDELRAELEKTMIELQESEDFPSIKEVVTNDALDAFTMKVNKSQYENSFDGFSLFSLGLSGMYYQLFDGASPEELEVTIFVEDVESGEVLNIVIFPDALEQLNTEN